MVQIAIEMVEVTYNIIGGGEEGDKTLVASPGSEIINALTALDEMGAEGLLGPLARICPRNDPEG